MDKQHGLHFQVWADYNPFQKESGKWIRTPMTHLQLHEVAAVITTKETIMSTFHHWVKTSWLTPIPKGHPKWGLAWWKPAICTLMKLKVSAATSTTYESSYLRSQWISSLNYSSSLRRIQCFPKIIRWTINNANDPPNLQLHQVAVVITTRETICPLSTIE